MKPFCLALLLTLPAPALLWAAAASDQANPAATELIDKVINARKTTGFRIRAKLIVVQAGSGKRQTRQLLIKGRRDGEATKILYQALWPDAYKGRALLVEKSADHKTTGFLFTPPDKVTPLTPEVMKQPFLESDLTLDDLAEDYWHWPLQKIVGQETVSGKSCQILESRPAGRPTAGYALVKTWICPDLALPLRVHLFDEGGQLVKRINVEKFFQQGTRWVPATIMIEPEHGRSRTTLDGSKSERDLDIPVEDFALGKIKSLAK
ncbi:MAG: outer membrane lipoprotein-sorting protein [Verrucomicrobiae bacterium]|nr:outer membrane lipoprotein-sorting protein [Verrucomicrobiae bacterium]